MAVTSGPGTFAPCRPRRRFVSSLRWTFRAEITCSMGKVDPKPKSSNTPVIPAKRYLLSDTPKLGHRCTQYATTANATHVVLTKGS